MKVNYSQLPPSVQQIFAKSLDHDTHSLNALKISMLPLVGHNDLFVAPELMYDFNESNYTLHTINLTKVLSVNVGPAKAHMYEKKDPTQKSYIIIDGHSGDTN